MNGVVYMDDKQVVKLVAYKLYDTEQRCEGRTVIEVAEFDKEVSI
jgi:Holliday junction resolvase RusA-like endonuclease